MEIIIKEFFLSNFYFILHLIIPGLITSLSLSFKHNSFLLHIISSFLLSILLIHLFSFVIVALKLDLSTNLYFLISYSLFLLLFKRHKIIKNFKSLDFVGCKHIVILCLFFVVVMAYNGGLLVIFSDAWWHMSYANKISITNQIFLDRHHLSGIEIVNIDSYLGYLPGWHLVLAILLKSSGLDLVIIWHYLAGFLIPLSLISYFLFAKSLTNNKNIALLSVILFCLLFGGLNSYFRISPWPGNVSYLIWYFLYYLAFSMLTDYQNSEHVNKPHFFSFIKHAYQQNTFLLFLALVSCYLILTIHASEVFWFAISFVFYYLMSCCLNPDSKSVTYDNKILALPVLLLIAISLILFFNDKFKTINWDLFTAGIMVPALLCLCLIVNHFKRSAKISLASSLVILAMFASFNLDTNQIVTLFNPVTELLSEYGYFHPYKVKGVFGNDLLLPQWEHQLREGILFAGLVSVIASFYLALTYPNRATVFLLGCCFFSFLTLVSPYLFTFLNQFTPYTSTYRVHLLIFHPLVIAYLFYQLYLQIFTQPENKNET